MKTKYSGNAPKYQLIENDIIDKINMGIYQARSILPSESELAIDYECSRVTVRKALSNLSYKGFITKTQGSKSCIKKTNTIQRTPDLKSFSEDMKDKGKIPSSKVVSFNMTDAGNTIGHLLNIKPNDKIYYIERIRCADGIPVLFEKTFMSVDLHPELTVKVLESSKYAYAKEHGLNIVYAYQNIVPIFAPDYIADAINISNKQPILRIANQTYLEDYRVFDYTELYLHPDLYQLNIVKYASDHIPL